MKQKSTIILPTLLIGFFIGIFTYDCLYEYKLHSDHEHYKLSPVGQTNINLTWAYALREGQYKTMVDVFELFVESNVLIFTNEGKDIKNLNTNDQCVLNQVKVYWIEECNRKCFPKLRPIFNEQNDSLIACDGNSKNSVNG